MASDLKINMEVANPGQEVVVTALLSNTGGSPGDYVAEMKINDAAHNETPELNITRQC